MPFSALNLHPALLRAIDLRGYSAPTPIQSAAIPEILQGRDIVASAQTGSGKTAAFCLPILQHWSVEKVIKPRKVHTLILVPTRELATQVGDALHGLAAYLPKPLKLAVVVGGVAINPQMLHLRGGADIVVATPGRLLDLIRHNAVSVAHIKILVLDEADRMLDLGFGEELQQVLAMLPAQRQNLLFSATMPQQVSELSGHALIDPVRIDVPHTPVSKPNITQRATELVALKLRKAKIPAEPFHGELGQGKRTQVLSDFKTNRIRVMVATDLAARGIDIPNLPVVINYDPPRSSADYTHRIGRTGRAGAAGMSVNFVCASNDAHFRFIEKSLSIALEREQLPGFIPVLTDVSAVIEEKGPGGIKGRRPSKKDKLRALSLAHSAIKPE